MKAHHLLFLLPLLLSACQPAEETQPTDTLPPIVETVEVISTEVSTPPEPDIASPTSELTVTTSQTETPTATTEATLAPTSTTMPTATPAPTLRPANGVQLVPFASGLSEPVFMTHAGDDWLYIVEKRGTIQIFENGQLHSQPFLDIQGQVTSTGYEQGLLSVAFHPGYEENDTFFVNYTDLQGATIVERFVRTPEDPYQADPASGQIILRIPQPYQNHNGGQLQFGPDGYLYIGMGDGGSAGDPQLRAQDPTVLLGKILRIDVDGAEPYELPADNPYYAMSSRRNEIWAIGVRNPWRFSFDRQTGDLFIADVGQQLWEEINYQPADSQGGENYGWNIMEGTHCYQQEQCDSSGLVQPIGEYYHEAGHCSVTGGYVYRGQATPELSGNYIFGDYCSGTIWRLYHMDDGSWSQAQIGDTDLFISSFGEDISGEIYVLDIIGGVIYRLALS